MVAISLAAMPLALFAAALGAPIAGPSTNSAAQVCPLGIIACGAHHGCFPEIIGCENFKVNQFAANAKRAEDVAENEYYYSDEDVRGLDRTGLWHHHPHGFPGFSSTHIIREAGPDVTKREDEMCPRGLTTCGGYPGCFPVPLDCDDLTIREIIAKRSEDALARELLM